MVWFPLFIFLDVLESGNAAYWEFAEQLMGDRRVSMQNIREPSLSATPKEDHVRQRIIVETTNAVKNIFLRAPLTRDFRDENGLLSPSAAGRPDAPGVGRGVVTRPQGFQWQHSDVPRGADEYRLACPRRIGTKALLVARGSRSVDDQG